MSKYVLYNKIRNDFFTCTGVYPTQDINDAQHYNYIPTHPDFEATLISDFPKKLYRYKEILRSSGGPGLNGEWEPSLLGPQVDLVLHEYEVVSETNKSYYINFSGFKWVNIKDETWAKKELKRVSKTERGSFAKDTKKKALESFIARKRRQIKILKSQLKIAENAKYQAENL